METPNNSIWGPELWLILHSSAERIGSQHLKRLSQDEWRIWSGILSSLRFSLPCPQCKKHYTDYYKSTPIPSLESVQQWLFQLHQHVNDMTNKPSFPLEHLKEKYQKPFHFSQHVAIVKKQMISAIRLQWVNHVDIHRTIRFLEELKRYYDFF